MVREMRRVFIFFLLAVFCAVGTVFAGQLKQDIVAEGSCMVVGMSAEQSQLIALQRARAAAIAEAAGIRVVEDVLVTNGRLAANFIRTYSKGYIVREKAEWLQTIVHQKDPSTPQTFEYRVRITADVYVPEQKTDPIGLSFKLNKSVFKSGENAFIEISTERQARLAVFNIRADDKVVMLFPNPYQMQNLSTPGQALRVPAKDSHASIVVQTMPGHKRDAEAIFVVAMDESMAKNFEKAFTPFTEMRLDEFFKKYSRFSDYSEDRIQTYEVVGRRQ